jgi:outer membrane protein TolC
VAAARERLSLAEQEVAQARERFQAGVASNADVITASLTLTTARTQLVDAQVNYQAARVALARAEGSITTLQ